MSKKSLGRTVESPASIATPNRSSVAVGTGPPLSERPGTRPCASTPSNTSASVKALPWPRTNGSPEKSAPGSKNTSVPRMLPPRKLTSAPEIVMSSPSNPSSSLPATIVLANVASPEMRTPPVKKERLLTIVELKRAISPVLFTAPPPSMAQLSDIVVWTKSAVPVFWTAPPPPMPAALRSNVVFST